MSQSEVLTRTSSITLVGEQHSARSFYPSTPSTASSVSKFSFPEYSSETCHPPTRSDIEVPSSLHEQDHDISAMHMLNLPYEVRLEMYKTIFQPCVKTFNVGNRVGQTHFLLPARGVRGPSPVALNMAQLLATCQQVYEEAQSVMYDNTTFHIKQQTFAGSLPLQFTAEGSTAPPIKHVIWSLETDILKKTYFEDFQLSPYWSYLESLELRIKSDNWRMARHAERRDQDDEKCAPTPLGRGREKVLEYAQFMKTQIGFSRLAEVDPARWNRMSEVRIRLDKDTRKPMAENDVLLGA